MVDANLVSSVNAAATFSRKLPVVMRICTTTSATLVDRFTKEMLMD
jgi:hypothetical protein